MLKAFLLLLEVICVCFSSIYTIAQAEPPVRALTVALAMCSLEGRLYKGALKRM